MKNKREGKGRDEKDREGKERKGNGKGREEKGNDIWNKYDIKRMEWKRMQKNEWNGNDRI